LELFITILIGIIIFAIAFSLRVMPLWKYRNRGVDAYYYLLCVEEFKKKKRIPIVLPPYFRLENQEQWYPPGFAIFLSLFPKRLLEKYYWAISPIVECLIIAVLYAVVYIVTGNIWIALLGGLLYSIHLTSLWESFALTSRQLGSLLLVIVLLSLFGYINYNNYFLLAVFLLAGFFLLMTHKMSTQLLWFALPLMSLVFWDPVYILGGIAIMVLTFILSGGFYVKVLRAHYDILSFWNRNWRNLGAHQVNSSPVYGDEARHDANRFFKKGPNDLLRHFRSLGIINFFVVMLIFPLIFYPQLSFFDQQMLWWVILTYILAALTLFVPQLRFFGEGTKYLKMAVLPVLYLTAVTLSYKWDINYYYYPLLVVCILVTIYVDYRFKQYVERNKFSPEDSDFKQIVAFFANEGGTGVIGCIPCGMADAIAYYCRRSVLWGTHSYGFRQAEPFFPVLRKPLEFFIAEYGISHLVIDSDYVSPETLRLSPANRVFVASTYEIYQTKTH
jgi:hypothetical protein